MRRGWRLTLLLFSIGGIVACNEEDCGLATLALYGDDPAVRVLLGNADPGSEVEFGNIYLILGTEHQDETTLLKYRSQRIVNLGVLPKDAHVKFFAFRGDDHSLITSEPCTYTGRATLAIPTVIFQLDEQEHSVLRCGSGW